MIKDVHLRYTMQLSHVFVSCVYRTPLPIVYNIVSLSFSKYNSGSLGLCTWIFRFPLTCIYIYIYIGIQGKIPIWRNEKPDFQIFELKRILYSF